MYSSVRIKRTRRGEAFVACFTYMRFFTCTQKKVNIHHTVANFSTLLKLAENKKLHDTKVIYIIIFKYLTSTQTFVSTLMCLKKLVGTALETELQTTEIFTLSLMLC